MLNKVKGSELVPFIPNMVTEVYTVSMINTITQQNDHNNFYPICKSGRRSEAVATYLERQGFSNVHSLEGGILGWIASIDPSLEAY